MTAPAVGARCATVAAFRQLACCLVAACAMSPAVRAQEEDPLVLIRRVVPADFRDEEFSKTSLPKLLTNSISRAVHVAKDDTVSGILKEEFNVVQSEMPDVYRQLEAHVLSANDLSNPSRDLKAGQVLKVPDLPRAAQTAFDPNFKVPDQAIGSISTTWDYRLAALVASPKFSSDVSATARHELQVRAVPLSALKALATPNLGASLTDLMNNGDQQFMQESLVLSLDADVGAGSSANWLTETDKVALRAFIAKSAQTRPLVVVLDDSFPSNADFRHAVEFVGKASRAIRAGFRLQDAAHGDSPGLIALEKNYKNGTWFCGGCEYPTLRLHSAMIREALRELTETDVGGLVEVVYLPVNVAQPYSKELLAEIFRVTLLADSVTFGLALALDDGTQCPRDVERGKPDYDSIQSQVDILLRSSSLGGALVPYQPGVPMVARTDKAVIDAVVNFLWLYSRASRRPHFLSMSWTTANLQYSTLFRPNGYGLWLAAAGNDPSINVHSNLRQFAARSSDPGDVLAVRNLASACASSSFIDDPNLPVFGFAFPGRISPSMCGTSFSTPRIAWLLAAHEAIKGSPVQPCTVQMDQWRALKKNRLLALQQNGQSGDARFGVSLWKLLGESAPPAN
jgi:hypothetical protein